VQTHRGRTRNQTKDILLVQGQNVRGDQGATHCQVARILVTLASA